MPIRPVIRILDHVRCERLGTGEFKVVAEDALHYTLECLTTGARREMYKALVYRDITQAFANRDRRVARATAIGRPKVRPGKRV